MAPSKPGFPFRLFALAFVFSIVAALIGAALSWQIHQRVEQMVEKHIAMARNVGRIMQLDEALTMSARMAAATGDMRYELRYDQLDPQLTATIGSVRSLLPEKEVTGFVGETDAANAALVKMERQAFALARQGSAQEATALLASDEYLRLKDAYAGGMRKTIEAVDALIESENRKANIVLLSSVVASVLSVLIFMLTWLLAVKSAKSWIVERGQVEETLRKSGAKLTEEQRRTSELIEVLPNPIYFKGTDGRYLGVNKAWETYFGRSRQDFVGKTVHELYPDNPEVAARLHADDQAVWGHPGSHSYETTITTADGSLRNAIYYKATFAAADGSVAGLIGTIVDITERKQAESALDKSERGYRIMIDSAPEGVWMIGPDRRTTEVNQRMCDLLGYARKDMLGRNPVAFADEENGQVFQQQAQCVPSRQTRIYEVSLRHRDGYNIPTEFSATTLFEEEGSVMGVLAFVTDLTERKRMEYQVRQMAFHDALTNLPNRRLLNDRLSQTMAANRRTGCHGAILFLDLDNFKPLNDTHGHDVGDLLLIEAANRLKSCVREVDTVARFGGDEFVVMISELDAGESESTQQVGIIAEKIRVALAKPYVLQARHDGAAETAIKHQCTTSIGVTLFGKHETSQEDILKRADAAMYQAKEAGRNLIRFYE